MRYRVFIGTGFALGFLAGAWAGRDRYDAVMRRVRGLKDNPSVHATAGLLQAQAAGAVGTAKRAVTGAPVTTGGGGGGAATDRRAEDLGSINGTRRPQGDQPG